MMEVPPATSSIVYQSKYKFGDRAWIKNRAKRQAWREPLSIYEVHLGSWRRVTEEENRPLTYREMAPLLTDYVTQRGFTHVEFLPLKEHPYGPSWGYQVSAYYAPSARYGTPDDFRFLVDHLHRSGIGVIMDWVPAHFPKDAFALGRFDGTATYEHLDPRKASILIGALTSSITAETKSVTFSSRTRSIGCANFISTDCALMPSRQCSTSITVAKKANGFRMSLADVRTSKPFRF
jgi:hypothetical protein